MSGLNDISEVKQTIAGLIASQKLAVLSTYGNGGPYASLVAIAGTEDLKYILFATTRSTRKYANLSAEAKVALLMDNRNNDEKDFSRAAAATALGRAEEIGGPEREPLLDLYLKKHPHLKDFVTSPSCALLKVRVEKYYLVSRFQNVQELHVS